MEAANKTLFPTPFNPYLEEVRKPTYKTTTSFEDSARYLEKSEELIKAHEKYTAKVTTGINNMNKELNANRNRLVGFEISRENEAINRIRTSREVNTFDTGRIINVAL